ncbi:MAG: TIGR00730 family Rossman fold protein [Desulfobacteraceae bacterium]|nr:TIGR00730 family Rossman fold protein [Desulfobacteraceae bacterium]
MNSICIFLGSNPGADPVYARAARDMGRELAANGITCVYGGSDTGLMKLLADSALEAGGRVVGVTVQALRDKEIFHPGLTELHVVTTMNERKALMTELSNGFVALPGGVGTFEEFFEIYTLSLLGFHSKPFGLLNINNYYAPLDALLDHAEREGFLKAPHRKAILRADTPADMVKLMMDR